MMADELLSTSRMYTDMTRWPDGATARRGYFYRTVGLADFILRVEKQTGKAALAPTPPAPAEPAPAPKVCENCLHGGVESDPRCDGCGTAMEKWEAIPPAPKPEPTATVKSCETCGNTDCNWTSRTACLDRHWTPRPSAGERGGA